MVGTSEIKQHNFSSGNIKTDYSNKPTDNNKEYDFGKLFNNGYNVNLNRNTNIDPGYYHNFNLQNNNYNNMNMNMNNNMNMNFNNNISNNVSGVLNYPTNNFGVGMNINPSSKLF